MPRVASGSFFLSDMEAKINIEISNLIPNSEVLIEEHDHLIRITMTEKKKQDKDTTANTNGQFSMFGTESVTQQTKTNGDTKKFNFRESLISLGIDEQVATDWINIRKSKKASDSITAFNRIKTTLERLENEKSLLPNNAITICVLKGWYGCEYEYFNNINLNEYIHTNQTPQIQPTEQHRQETTQEMIDRVDRELNPWGY